MRDIAVLALFVGAGGAGYLCADLAPETRGVGPLAFALVLAAYATIERVMAWRRRRVRR